MFEEEEEFFPITRTQLGKIHEEQNNFLSMSVEMDLKT